MPSPTKSDAKEPPPEASSSSEVDDLRRQVRSLTAENAALKKELAQTKKRASAAAPAAAAAPPAKKARTAGQKKKLFEKWAKAVMRESKKQKVSNGGWGPDPFQVTVKEASPWSEAEFHAMFDGHGKKIQPTPDNKPTSVITILQFDTFGSIRKFFQDVGGADIPEEGYQVQNWRKRNFAKSWRSDDMRATLSSMDVHYNKSKQALSIVFLLWSDPE